MRPVARVLWVVLASLAAGCDGGPSFEQGVVDLEALPHANGGCEAPSDVMLSPGSGMLPGRVCMDCHREESEAKSVFTAAGTVYGVAEGACNEAGLEGVLVEILNQEGEVQVSLTTNPAGNFYTSDPIDLPMRVRLSKDDKTAVMTSSVGLASCATCHQSAPQAGAPGRVYLD